MSIRMIAGIVIAVGVTGSGAALFAPEDVADPTVVDCHTTTELGEREAFDGTGVQNRDAGDGAPLIVDAVGACAELWRDGFIRPGAQNAQTPPPGAPFDVPDLTGCIAAGGVAAVFPAGPQICAQLGLAPLDR